MRGYRSNLNLQKLREFENGSGPLKAAARRVLVSRLNSQFKKKYYLRNIIRL